MKYSDVQILRATARRHFGCTLLPFLMVALAGCQAVNVSPSLSTHPETYRRVVILPIGCDYFHSADFLAATREGEANRQAGAKLAVTLTNLLARKGYQVVGPLRALCDESDRFELDLAAGGILRRQFDLEKIRIDGGKENEQCTCGFISSLTALQERLGLPAADAMVFLQRWQESPPPANRMPQTAENVALAGLGILALAGGNLDALGRALDSDQREQVLYGSGRPPAASTSYSLYIFDAHTHEIVYSAYCPARFENPGRAVRHLLGSLPEINN